MTRRLLTLAMALTAMLAVASSPATAQEGDAAEEGPDLSVDLGIDFTTAYFFRGIFQENQGIIAQPYAEIGLNLWKGEGKLSSVDGFIGIWNSVHEGPSGSGGPQSSWYEADIYIGVSATIDPFTIALAYTEYYSPNGVFGTTDEISVTVSYDDAGKYGKEDFGLAPYATIAFETDGGADGGTDHGIYLELGIEPGFDIIPDKLSLSFPVTLGLSLSDYYEDPVDGDDDFFGYLDIGIVATMPLDFIPAKFGAWEASIGVHFLILGDSTENISMLFGGGGDDFEVILVAGVSVGF